MKIDLTCPVELWRFQLPTPEYALCAFLLYNLSAKPVASVQVTLVCLDEAGEAVSRHVERVQGLAGEPQATFEIGVPVEPEIAFSDMELIIEKVWFDDNTVWRRGNATLTEYTPNTLPNTRRLEMLRFVAGEDAVGYPQDQGPVWLCVCGRANAASEEACRRCGRQKAAIFEQFNQNAIDAMIQQREQELAAIAKKAREDASEKERLREEVLLRKRRRKRRAIGLTVTVLCAAGAAYGIIFHGLPYYRYVRANEQLSSGLYGQAKAAFAEMGDYRDAQALILACDYQEALAQLQTGTEETLLTAQQGFEALGTYEDSAEMAQRACYERAQKRLTAQDYPGAAALFEEVSGYSDARLKISECRYSQALALMEAADYAAAREIFLALGDYSEAQKMASECLYRPGVAAMEESRWEDAMGYLSQVPDYLDVQTRLQAVNYQLAEALNAAGSYEKAGAYYIAAGDYRDASRKAGQCWYAQAKALMEKKKYGQAAEMFQQIADYEDAQALGFECVYQVALSAMNKKEYSRAYELLITIPAYQDAQALAQECLYQPALDAIRAGDYDGALAYLTKLPEDYKDTPDQIKEVSYRKAAKLLSAKDYEGAYAAFTALIPYSDSSRKAQEACYQQAKEAMAGKSYVTAAAYLTELAGYQDADNLLNEANYQLALSYVAEGQTQQALALLDGLSDFKDAKTQACALRYAAAQAVMAEGDYLQAAELFAQLGGYEDAAAQAKACRYQQAAQVKAAGDLAQAGRLFAQLEAYEDAAAQSEACFDAYYAAVYGAASAAMDQKDYKAVVDALAGIDLNDPPKKYADMADMYNKANYAYANQLYEADKPYEALVYYRNIPDYRDVSSAKLKRNCYQVLGKWISASGVQMEFRDNGTCNIAGEELYFGFANTYVMVTGTDPDKMAPTHRVSRVDAKSLSLRDTRGEHTITYKMTRGAEIDASAPAAEIAPPAEDGLIEMEDGE